MNPATNPRAQLESLRIPAAQRPGRPRGTAEGENPSAPHVARSGRRRVGWLVVLALVVLLGWGAYAGRARIVEAVRGAQAPVKVPVLRVSARAEPPPVPVLTATGKIVSDHRVQVVTKVSGQIVALFFEQGDRVERGALLARIEDVNYQARWDQAVANLEKSKARLEYERTNFERIARLNADGVAMAIEIADSKRALGEATAQVDADQAAVDYARKALDDCAVQAPIAGVVLERNVEVGDFVAAEGGRGANANAQFASIADMTKLRVEVDISELDINRIKPTTPCTIVPDAYKERRYTGQVLWIDPGANYSKATVQVKVRIENPDDYLRVEGSAQVTFLPEAAGGTPATPAAEGLWIPLTACVRASTGNAAKVFVAVDERLRETPVVIGRQRGNLVEITQGLADGQMIAAERVEQLSDGQRWAR